METGGRTFFISERKVSSGDTIDGASSERRRENTVSARQAKLIYSLLSHTYLAKVNHKDIERSRKALPFGDSIK
jgi:hypothetical protein